jgi:hypothetical protein
MLQAMQQIAERTSTPVAPSFAGLLAALAEPGAPVAERAPVWNDDGLADDVATLSYERALRAHTRYKYADPPNPPNLPNLPDRSLAQPADPEPIQELWVDDSPFEQMSTDLRPPYSAPDPQPKAAFVPTSALERDLKCASITIRLSKAENAQLRQRAVEAGLTISDYLRSCTFEAESLRALVKDTMAQLRASQPTPDVPKAKNAAPIPVRRSFFGWLLRLLPSWQSRQQAVRA